MFGVRDAIEALKGVMVLTEKVDRAGQLLQEMSIDVRDHEKRLIRLEARFDTADELGRLKENSEQPKNK